MKFVHILTELWCKPCLILPQMHAQICEIVQAHIDGSAHAPAGLIEAFELGRPEEEQDEGFSAGDEIAVIPIHGVIGKHVGAMAKSSGALDLEDVAVDVDAALADPGVRGIFYDINSPGGGTTGVPEVGKMIADASKEKPSVAYTDNLMASAAYWLGAGAGAIYASKSASIGSIGVYMAWLDSSRAYEMEGLRTELIKRGKFKAAGIDGVSLTDEQRDHLEGVVEKVYGWFIDAVKGSRPGVPMDAMEGQTFFADDALDVKLIDAVGSRDDAVAELLDMIRLGIK